MSNYIEPKVDWMSGDPVGVSDFNRIEKNIKALKDEDITLKGKRVFLDGFVLKNKSEDPASPEVGRLWYRE